MPKTEFTRLTIIWSKDTDRALRSYLGTPGLKKGALSRFVEDAVKWRLLDLTVTDMRSAFVDIPSDELENLINDAIATVRKGRRIRRSRSR